MMGVRRLAALACLWLAACGDGANPLPPPPPAELSREAVGHFCGMIVLDHPGPKGQIHVAGRAEPLWFSSVRDAIAFTLLPEETDRVLAIYVNDMGRAASWDAPGPGTWIDALEALYVIGSRRGGGMGAQEAVPFSTDAAARAFAQEHGGEVVGWDRIPPDYVLGDAWSPDPGRS